MTAETAPTLNANVRAYLTKRDGAVLRAGKAMLRLQKNTGYSIEALRSFAYNRRHAKPDARRTKLLRTVRRG